MKQYLDLLVTYLESGIKCAHLHEIKEKEIFLIFRWYYTNEEFVKLFYPIIGKSLDFRAMIIKNYSKVKSIGELASIVGMSRSNFDTKFKEVFGDPPKHWMLKRKAQSIRHFMSKPGITINDVMIQYGFDSYTHFNRFCKQQFGKSPSELMKEKNSSVIPE
jgi:AraC-like DNA-binding protein